ncbi:hypothetical protein DYB32_007941 [Aphanomyces invadans]|uniref:KH type-2 domain-containing protein n=1 Tax=Aphanomyces invadans TaxID=157072 RepID=A0A3R6VHF5_9STRA|nr:hypothetical protein DYB32_007941 [Aphanomyces invadans]
MDLVGPTERPHVAKRIEVLSDMIEEAFATHAPKDEDVEDFEDDDGEEFEGNEDDDDDDDDYEEFDMDDFEDFEDDSSELELEPTKYLRDNCIKVSAHREKDVAKLRQELLDLAVERPWMFHSRMKSDRSDLELVTEIIREKLYRRFNQELPYMVPSDRHVKTLLGKKGDTLREVGTAARKDIEMLLGRKVHLYLNIRARDTK